MAQREPYRPLASLLELTALSSLAVAYPVLELLGRFGAFLVAHELAPGEILALAVALATVPPLALWLIELAGGGLSARLAVTLHLLFVGLLTALWALRLLAVLAGLGAALAAAVALAAGVLASLLVRRQAAVRTALAWAALGGLLFVLHFLLLSPAARLLRGTGEEVRAGLGAAAAAGPPLVLIVFDELPMGSLLTPAGEVDAERFPHFAALADDGVLFTRATTVASGTAYAVPAILTGRYPVEKRLPIHLDYRENLFTLLAGRYRIHAHETLTRLCPQGLCPQHRPPAGERFRALGSDLGIVYLHLVSPPPVARRLPSIRGRWRDFAGRGRPGRRGGVVTVERAERLDIPGLTRRYLEGIDGARGVLHYLHLELPHIPWRYLPSGVEYGPVSHSNFAIGVGEGSVWRDDEWLLRLALQRHLAQTVYADRVLGEVVATLRARGLYEEALLIVTADHGLAFQIGEPGRDFTEANLAEVAAVPLLLRGPGMARGRVDERPVEVVDILPTLAEAAGVEPPWPVDGRSLLDAGYRGRPSQRLTDPDDGVRAVISGPAVAQSNLRAAQRIAAAFPRPGIEGLFRIGRHLEMVDRPTAALAQRAGDPVEVTLTQSWLYDAVDPASGFLPARVDGRLWSAAPADSRRDLAVAVNGVVRAMTRSHPEGGAERFSALLPETAFAPGANAVEVFVVEETGSGPVLVPTRDRSGPGYRLARSASGELLGVEATNDTGCALSENAVLGEVVRDGLTFWGWALDPSGRSPAVIVMAFVDGDLVWAGPTGSAPPDGAGVAELPGFAASGFLFGLTRPLLRRGEESELLLLGVVGDRCSQLPITGR